MSNSEPIMDFSNIILSYAVNATIHLGLSPDPSTGQITRDLNRAKDLIDMLDLLKLKTNWEPEFSLEEGIDLTINYIKNNIGSFDNEGYVV